MDMDQKLATAKDVQSCEQPSVLKTPQLFDLAFYCPKQMGLPNLIPDQALEYLARTNIWDSKHAESGLLELMGRSEKTYDQCIHPLFSRGDVEWRESWCPLIGFETVEGVRNFLSKREELENVPHDQRYNMIRDSGLLGKAPYSHGAEFTSYVYGPVYNCLMADRNIQVGAYRAVPILDRIFFGAHDFLSTFKHQMASYDLHAQFAERDFTDTYMATVRNLIEIYPRFVSLAAREPFWDIRALEEHIKAQGISGIDEVIAPARGSKEYGVIILGKLDPSNPSDKEIALFAIQVAGKVSDAMKSYLEDRVKYI